MLKHNPVENHVMDNKNEDGLSWVGASWQRSLELAELEYQLWQPKQKEEDGKAKHMES